MTLMRFSQLLSGLEKFMFSQKATKIDEIFTVDLTLCSKCQTKALEPFLVKQTVKISSICVAFLRKHEL